MRRTLLVTLSLAALVLPTFAPGAAATSCGGSAFTLNSTYSDGFVSPSAPTDWWVFSGTDVVYTLTPLTNQGDLGLTVWNSTCTLILCSSDAIALDASEQCRAIGTGPHYIEVVWYASNPASSNVKYRLDPYKIS